MKNLDIVVAKYREDVSWIQNIKNANITVYDKSGDSDAKNPLPNVGREAHTYLHHIIKNYDNMADVTLFVQGNPFEHCVDFLRRVRKLPPDEFHPISDALIVDDWEGYPNHAPRLNMKPVADLVGDEKPNYFLVHAAAMFSVPKRLIHNKPLDFWKKLYKYTIEEEKAAWELERIWPLIFREDQGKEGIIAACNSKLFMDFRLFHQSFIASKSTKKLVLYNLGLTLTQIEWCNKNEIKVLPPFFQIESRIKHRMEEWFQWVKPFLIYTCPFDRVLWLDVDTILLNNPDELFETLKEKPIIFADTYNGEKICANHKDLYKHLPVKYEYTKTVPQAGVLGLCKKRDNGLISSWLWAVQWALEHREHSHLFSWWDQGAFLWALQKEQLTHLINTDNSWNKIIEVRRAENDPFTPLLKDCLLQNKNFLEVLKSQYPDVNLIHYAGGNNKLSKRFSHELEKLMKQIGV